MRQIEPHVFTVILNWNQADMTMDCLRSLAEADYSYNTVVVVDNGSTDGSPARISDQFPSVVVIESRENLGYSEGNNLGINYAMEQGADYIFLLNNDTIVDPLVLSKLVQVAESDPQTGVVGPSMFYYDLPDILWGGENRIDWKRANAVRLKMGQAIPLDEVDFRPAYKTDYIDSCAVLVRREVIEKVGGLNGKYFINFDDLDLNLRASRAGYQVVYVPSARIWHRVSAAMGIASPATTYYMTRNSMLFFWTHAPGIWKYVDLLFILLRSSRTVAAWTLKRAYQVEAYRRKRDANLYAIRDFFLGRFGKMGPDVARVCFKA